MIELEDALKGLSSVKEKLRSAAAITNPTIMSEQMYRLSQYAGCIDDHLEIYQKEYETKLAATALNKIKEGMKVSPATELAKMELAELRAQVHSLELVSRSAWRQVGAIQSRVNHLVTESRTNI